MGKSGVIWEISFLIIFVFVLLFILSFIKLSHDRFDSFERDKLGNHTFFLEKCRHLFPNKNITTFELFYNMSSGGYDLLCYYRPDEYDVVVRSVNLG